MPLELFRIAAAFGVGWSALVVGVCAQVLPASDPAVLAGQRGSSVFVNFGVGLGNDALTLREFRHIQDVDFVPKASPESARTRSNFTFLIAEAGSGFRWEDWEFSILRRRDAYMTSSQDATYLAYLDKLAVALPQGAQLQMQLNLLGHEFQGLRLAKGMELIRAGDLKISGGGALTVLQGTRYRNISGSGTASSTLIGYQYSGSLTDTYSNASYPYLRDGTPLGQGYTTDVAIHVQHPQWGKIKLLANDWRSSVAWKNLPHTELNADSQTMTRDQFGYVVYNAILTGVNDINRRNEVEHLPTRLTAEWAIPWRGQTFKYGTQRVWGTAIPYAGIEKQWGDYLLLGLSHDFRWKGWRLDFSYPRVKFGLIWDKVPITEARSIGMQITYMHPFH